MNMKRGLVLSLTALALVVGSSAAQAQTNNVDLSLNLRYTDPAAPAEGGTWYLVAQSDAAFGVAGLSVYLSNINTTGIVFGNNGVLANGYAGVTGATLGANVNNGGNPLVTTAAGITNIVYGQDLATIVSDVGKGAGTPGNIATDPLKNTAWNNAALLLSGTFGATRPAFATSGGNSTDANVFTSATPGTATADATVTTTVRGDSLNTLNLESAGGTEGLRFGDRNRDFAVNISTDILPALANIGLTGQGWDQGDFNNSGTVNISADILPALANIGLPGLPPAVAAVPEPASVGLALFGMVAMGALRKRFA
jgi:hypothetical protein